MGFEHLAAVAWQRYLCHSKSFLVDLFQVISKHPDDVYELSLCHLSQGQLESRISCCFCGEASVKFEPFMYLSLPIHVYPNIQINSLEGALAGIYTECEPLLM